LQRIYLSPNGKTAPLVVITNIEAYNFTTGGECNHLSVQVYLEHLHRGPWIAGLKNCFWGPRDQV
jgi:hypothetical protein